ncbi:MULTISPECIES: hypothetical protein [unclassified Bradyrhizobium]|uniref:hypothetical protein n=1 Tax=unclassified Bradyrhizobium TaxID=2631580 RepID=UPI002479790C|nr:MULTISPECIES: hypothetical protein [unclassified Bradyrhizobium]WGS18791.1 hypothetical protein MTX22_30300 [Bradyrhizobium sp. ISRA463]WGS25617.1 hypothetical protein MTX19_27880 [Bradyrhizobium sp. ISRA464]
MKTILEAVDRHLGRNNCAVAPAQARLDALFEQFDIACKGLDRLPDLEARRREARRLMAILIELDTAMRADARSRREDDLRASLRYDQHFRLAMRNFEGPGEWTQEQCLALLAEGAE